MLQTKHKLNSILFSKTFSGGKKIHSDNLMVIYKSDMANFKAAVVVSKKQTKTAILRNYKRRQVFNVVNDLYKEDSHKLTKIHMIVMVKKGSLGIKYAQIKQEMERVISKI